MVGARGVAHVAKSIFRRSMPSDLIRGWKPVRRRKCDYSRTIRANSDSSGTKFALREIPRARNPDLIRAGLCPRKNSTQDRLARILALGERNSLQHKLDQGGAQPYFPCEFAVSVMLMAAPTRCRG
jgi:hypothetical protein